MPIDRRLRLADYVPSGGCFHALRVQKRGSAQSAPRIEFHCHDFVEAFWIERGSCRHAINGMLQDLGAGDLVLVGTGDVHGFAAPGARGYVMVNVAFAADELERVRRRLYGERGRFPWDADERPARRRLSASELGRFRDWGDRLGAMRQDRVEFEAFLLDLLATCGTAESQPADDCPAWLASALRAFAEPRHLAEGLPALLHLSGRGREHLNRTCRRYRGLTATDLVNEMRLQHAAARLRGSDDAILDIVLSCGFNHLGYFYRRFRARFGATPRRWRLRERDLVR